jgi:hypothetical protein
MKKFFPLFIVLVLVACINNGIMTSADETYQTTLIETQGTQPINTEVSSTPTPLPSSTSSPTPTPESTQTPAPTDTPQPTSNVLPPTPISLPATAQAEAEPATHKVCASGCRFTTIQGAIDHAGTGEVIIIEIIDPVHTEASIVLDKDVTIRGQGVDQTIVQAYETLDAAPDRVFLVKRGATVYLEGMTIRHGKPAVEDEKGGGIRNFGTLTLRNCTVRANSANGGGGIGNSAALTLVDSTVMDNIAYGIGPRGHECGNGGGIQCGSGTMMIYNSTITGNQGGVKGRARGGGVHVGCGCQAVIINSTISNNEASREGGLSYSGGDSLGGGIYIAGELELINSTVVGNRAAGGGGGIYNIKQMDMMNTIIADNRGSGGNCVLRGEDAQIGINMNNWVADGGCGSQFSGDVMLDPLADNGGPTLTHALLPGSPAIDAVPEDHCYLPTDQRGVPRPAGAGIDAPLCDIGAFELGP